MDKLVCSSFGKRHLDHVAIAWSGKPEVDSIIGVYDDVGGAMAASNDGQTNLTQVMFNTPGNIGDDGRIWVLVDGAAIFSAHCSASAAAAQRTLSARFGRTVEYEDGHAEGYEVGYKKGYDEGFQ